MCGELWKYLLMDLSIVLSRQSYISVSFGVHVKAQRLQVLSEVFNQRPPGKMPLVMWNYKYGLSQHRERGGESQLLRVTGKCHERQLGHGLDQVETNGLIGFLSGLGSKASALTTRSWRSGHGVKQRSKIQYVCNYMPVQGIFAILLLWLLTHNPSSAPWRYLYKI